MRLDFRIYLRYGALFGGFKIGKLCQFYAHSRCSRLSQGCNKFEFNGLNPKPLGEFKSLRRLQFLRAT